MTYRTTKDLITTGVEIRLFGLQKDNKPFNPSLFYNAILDDPTSDSFSCHPKLEQLEAIVKSKRAKSRSQFHLPLKLSDHLSIGVTGYNMIIEQRISTAKYFYTAEDEVKEAIGTTRWICVVRLNDSKSVYCITHFCIGYKSTFDAYGYRLCLQLWRRKNSIF